MTTPSQLTPAHSAPQRRRGRLAAVVPALALGLALTAAACGSTKSDTPTVPELPKTSTTLRASTGPSAQTGAAPKTFDEARLAFAQCMRTNGVAEFPDPVPGRAEESGGPVSKDPDYATANKTCTPLLSAVTGGSSPSSAQVADRQKRVLALASCMRSQGIDFPDPKVGDDGNLSLGAGADPSNPKFGPALQKCTTELAGSGAQGATP